MRLLAALLVLVPCFALSQSTEPQSPSPQPEPGVAGPAPTAAAPVAIASPVAPSPPAEESPARRPEPRWSIGAGISLFGGVQFISLAPVPVPPALGVAASIERRLSREIWLTLGLDGAAHRERHELDPTGSGLLSSGGAQITLEAGLRRVLTRLGAPVEVSAVAEAQVGYGREDQTTVPSAGASETDASARSLLAGVEVGIAVERELSPGLSLRLATPLAAVSWTWSRVEIENDAGGPPHDVGRLSANAALRPRLELRLEF